MKTPHFFLFLLIFSFRGTFANENSLSVVPQSQESENDDSISVSEENQFSNEEIFVATNEWQTIKPGQAIPRGLHVRMDLTTGEKQAKLMDKNEVTDSQEKTTFDHKQFSRKTLENALKNIGKDQEVRKSV